MAKEVERSQERVAGVPIAAAPVTPEQAPRAAREIRTRHLSDGRRVRVALLGANPETVWVHVSQHAHVRDVG